VLAFSRYDIDYYDDDDEVHDHSDPASATVTANDDGVSRDLEASAPLRQFVDAVLSPAVSVYGDHIVSRDTVFCEGCCNWQ
jgi:hypothetical protein